jgi:hypothetical protein
MSTATRFMTSSFIFNLICPIEENHSMKFKSLFLLHSLVSMRLLGVQLLLLCESVKIFKTRFASKHKLEMDAYCDMSMHYQATAR